MKLENIGFYTLSDDRAKSSSVHSPLWRCELILTNKCNFKCKYCRGIGQDISLREAFKVLELWTNDGLKNVRFSGGEPTLYKDLPTLVTYCRLRGVERIALSTNGSADFEYYKMLIESGVNDFSISLDSCCSSESDEISGKSGMWEKVCENIEKISKLTYTTLGIVINEDNLKNCLETIKFAYKLGVSDVRVIPSAQYNVMVEELKKLPDEILNRYPILRYRKNNTENGIKVRGLSVGDSGKCKLVLDDMAVMGKHHYPCIIYMRESGNPIGKVSDRMRNERLEWYKNHDSFKDDICRNNCLDVCIDFNNTAN